MEIIIVGAIVIVIIVFILAVVVDGPLDVGYVLPVLSECFSVAPIM